MLYPLTLAALLAVLVLSFWLSLRVNDLQTDVHALREKIYKLEKADCQALDRIEEALPLLGLEWARAQPSRWVMTAPPAPRTAEHEALVAGIRGEKDEVRRGKRLQGDAHGEWQ